MQDVHELLGGGEVAGGVGSGGRIFGDRRTRAAPHGHHHQQALKCPRCDSLNTKFCYYNNYNLSQPRHFCKNCRRYWTKGGVLRNVPVGGGCRKSKRSSKRKPSDSPQRLLLSAAKDRHLPNSGSSSESTSAKGDIVFSSKPIGVAKAISEAGSEYSSSPLFPFSEQPPATVTFNDLATEPLPLNANFEGGVGIHGGDSGTGGVFTETGSFVSLIDRDQNQNLLGFTNVETTPFGMHQQNQVNNQLLLQNLSTRDWQKEKMDGVDNNWGQGIFDQTVHVDLLTNAPTGDGVLAGGNWHGVPGGGGAGGGGGHLGMFDLSPGSEWSQSSQWHESDHHLYLPP